MKKLLKTVFTLLIAAVLTAGVATVYGADSVPINNVPYITEISFNNGEIEGGFNQNKTEYNLILANQNASPSLKDYKINGNANLFVNYTYNELNVQTGITVTLSFQNGSVIYTFNYKNKTEPVINSNANLAGISCEYGELQPGFDKSTTNYKLYIPKDLTDLTVTPITDDINAYCPPLNMQLREGQESDFNFTVTASDGTVKIYKFKIKRVNKTVAEIKEEMSKDDFDSFVNGELFYQKPAFAVVTLSVIGGILVIIILALITKRITVNPYDSEEKEFYTPIE